MNQLLDLICFWSVNILGFLGVLCKFRGLFASLPGKGQCFVVTGMWSNFFLFNNSQSYHCSDWDWVSLAVQIIRSIQSDVGIFNATYLGITSVVVLRQRLLIKGSPWALINRRLQAAGLSLFLFLLLFLFLYPFPLFSLLCFFLLSLSSPFLPCKAAVPVLLFYRQK